jgi:hypothetical protein
MTGRGFRCAFAVVAVLIATLQPVTGKSPVVAFEEHSDPAVSTMPVSAPASFTCFDDGSSGRRVQALYLWKDADRAPADPGVLQDMLGRVSAIIDPTDTLHVRFMHGADCRPVVTSVHLTKTQVSTFGRTTRALADLGYDAADRKYVLFAESGVYCGIATVVRDSSPSSANLNNSGTGYARVDRDCWASRIVTHELAHTLGAVQPDAPHATKYWHCTDEEDVMCYHDGAGSQMKQRCPDEVFDCGNDDYFSLVPSGYLASHWNLATSSFLG